jgi:hypothetical protein
MSSLNEREKRRAEKTVPVQKEALQLLERAYQIIRNIESELSRFDISA